MAKRNREFWWRVKDEPHKNIFSSVEFLRDNQGHHYEAALHHMRMYSNRLALGLSAKSYSVHDSGERLKLNVVKSVIDSAAAHISSKRTRPMFVTEKGSQSLKTKSKNLGRFIGGQFYATSHYDVAASVFMDACILGDGYEHVYDDNGKIMVERVFPNELTFDDHEAKYGKPRQLFRSKELNREFAAELWPEFAGEIEGAKLLDSDADASDGLADPISIIEAWHLPSSDDAGDGRHIIAISGATIVDEPWTRNGFPFARFCWSEPPLGYRGIGLAEELVSIQVEINFLLQKIQRLMWLATAQIWLQKGSGVTSESMSNQDMAIRTYKNQPPILLAPSPVSPEYFSHLDRLYQRAFEIAGISQLSAQGQKPAGLNSGEALRVYSDIGSQRFQHINQRWDKFHLDVAELMIETARDIEARGDGDLAVMAHGDKEIEEIRFSDVSIDKDKYSMRVWPTSLLPDTPAGKLQTIKELAEISPELQRYVMHLLDVPDLEDIRSLINAPIELVDKTLEQIVVHGQYRPPLPFMDLDMARHRATLTLLRAENDGVDEDRLELLRVWLSQLDEMQQAQLPPPVPAALPPMGMPPPGPMMQPGQPQLPPEAMAAAMSGGLPIQ